MATISKGSEFIEVDRGGERFTHHPSGDTCLRHPWMRGNGRDTAAWIEKRDAFFDRHPNAHLLAVLRNAQTVIIGDVRDFPGRGSEFKIGDRVVTLDRERQADCVREIVAVRPNGDPSARLPQDHPVCYLLEDGELMYWSTEEDAWKARNRDGSEPTRVRRPVHGEALDGRDLTSGEIVRKTIPHMFECLTKVGANHYLWPSKWAQASGITQDEIEQALTGLSAAQETLGSDVSCPGNLSVGMAAVATAGTLARSIAASKGAKELGLLSAHYDVEAVADRAEAVLETLTQRGISASDSPRVEM